MGICIHAVHTYIHMSPSQYLGDVPQFLCVEALDTGGSVMIKDYRRNFLDNHEKPLLRKHYPLCCTCAYLLHYTQSEESLGDRLHLDCVKHPHMACLLLEMMKRFSSSQLHLLRNLSFHHFMSKGTTEKSLRALLFTFLLCAHFFFFFFVLFRMTNGCC